MPHRDEILASAWIRQYEVLSLCVFMQLMVANTVDGSYVFCGEVGGSVVNALHFGRDPRGKQPSSLGVMSVMLATYLTVQPLYARLADPILEIGVGLFTRVDSYLPSHEGDAQRPMHCEEVASCQQRWLAAGTCDMPSMHLAAQRLSVTLPQADAYIPRKNLVVQPKASNGLQASCGCL